MIIEAVRATMTNGIRRARYSINKKQSGFPCNPIRNNLSDREIQAVGVFV
jgi:hypothetical protein